MGALTEPKGNQNNQSITLSLAIRSYITLANDSGLLCSSSSILSHLLLTRDKVESGVSYKSGGQLTICPRIKGQLEAFLTTKHSAKVDDLDVGLCVRVCACYVEAFASDQGYSNTGISLRP